MIQNDAQLYCLFVIIEMLGCWICLSKLIMKKLWRLLQELNFELCLNKHWSDQKSKSWNADFTKKLITLHTLCNVQCTHRKREYVQKQKLKACSTSITHRLCSHDRLSNTDCNFFLLNFDNYLKPKLNENILFNQFAYNSGWMLTCNSHSSGPEIILQVTIWVLHC